MPRIKRGVVARRRHKKILDRAKGYYGARSRVYRVAKQAVIKAGQYAYRDRRQKKRQFRALWITRCHIAAVQQGVFIGGTIESIRIMEYSSMMTALSAVADGQADLFGHAINRTDYSVLDAYPELVAQWADDTRACVLTMNADQYPLGNSHLRRAIAHALDQTQIAEFVMNSTVTVADFLLPLSSCYQIETSQGGKYYHPDLSAATHELGLAGMLDVDEDGVVEGPNGNEIAFTLHYPFDMLGMNETATLVSSALLLVGLNNTPVPVRFTDLQQGLESHSLAYSIALNEMQYPEYDPTWGITTFHSSLKAVAGQCRA